MFTSSTDADSTEGGNPTGDGVDTPAAEGGEVDADPLLNNVAMRTACGLLRAGCIAETFDARIAIHLTCTSAAPSTGSGMTKISSFGSVGVELTNRWRRFRASW